MVVDASWCWGGRLVRVDEATVLSDPRQLAEVIGLAAAEDFRRMDGTSARSMRADRL